MKKILPAKQLLNPGLEVLTRLMSRVKFDRKTGCWNWQGYQDVRGYGQIKVARLVQWVHRVSYACWYGEAPAGMELDHQCHNTSCVRPDHLVPKTHSDNTIERNVRVAKAKRKSRKSQVPF